MTNTRVKIRREGPVIGLFILAIIFVSACAPQEVGHWYKGNLHTHTTFSDGDTPPEGVIQWYRDHGYHFLAITDHNFLLDIGDYGDFVDDGFILISGNEISDAWEDKPLHLLALGLYNDQVGPTRGENVVATLQNNVSAIRQAGAVPVLAHPNFYWAFGAEEMIGIDDCLLFEVLNAHPAVNNAGDETHPSTEEMWDQVLSTGKRIYGIGTDDMHKLATYPGKSWVMVRAPELKESAILDAMEAGDFYVSTGIVLDEYIITPSAVKIRIRSEGETLYTTTFIGQGGRVLASSGSLNPVFKKSPDLLYVRAKIEDSEGKAALTQPVFFDK